MDREQFDIAVRAFFKSMRPASTVDAVRGSDNLFDAGILDSLGMVELISYLEELLDSDLDIDHLSLRAFHTIDGMYEHVVAPTLGHLG